MVIGAAGAVGFHMVQELRRLGVASEQIVAFDSFSINLDIPPILEYQRAAKLQQPPYSIEVRKFSSEGAACTSSEIINMLQHTYFSHVLLLAPFTETRLLQKVSDQHSTRRFVDQSVDCLEKLIRKVASSVRKGGESGSEDRSTMFIYQLPELRHKHRHVSQEMLPDIQHQLYSAVAHLNDKSFHKYNVNIVGLKFDSLYGPWDNPSNDIYKCLMAAYHRLPASAHCMQIHEDSDYLFFDDAVQAILLTAAMHPHNRPLIMSVEASKPTSKADGDESAEKTESLVDIIARATGNRSQPGASGYSTGHASKDLIHWSSATGAMKEYGWCSAQQILQFTAKTSLFDGVRQLAAWYSDYERRVFPCASECVSYEEQELCFPNEWDHIVAVTRALTQRCKNVYYTVAIDSTVNGIHDLPKMEDDPSLHCNIAFVSRNCPFVLNKGLDDNSTYEITQRNYFQYHNWTVVLVGNFTAFADHRKPTRVPKLSPSKFFAESVHYAVYMDSKLLITCDPRDYIAMMSSHHPDNRGNSLALLAVRISEHEEGIFYHIDHVLERLAERPSITYYPEELEHQGRIFKATEKLLGVRFLNLFDGAFMVHDLWSEVARSFRCDWYREYQQWSDRDQVAASYVLTMRAHAMHSNATVWRNNYIPVGIEGVSDSSAAHNEYSALPKYGFHLPGYAYSSQELKQHRSEQEGGSDDDDDWYSYHTGDVRYVRLLPRYEYHWTKNPGRIGHEVLFDWNRLDDGKGIVPPEVKLAWHKHKQELKAARQAAKRNNLVQQRRSTLVRFSQFLVLLFIVGLLYKLFPKNCNNRDP